jgi:hypothetical protein
MGDRDRESRHWCAALLALGVCVFFISDLGAFGWSQSRGNATGRNDTAAPALVTTISDEYQEPPDGWGPQCSRDRIRCAYLARRGADAFVVVNGKPGASYEDVRDIVFSADATHVAYRAKRGASWMVVVDGKEGVPFDTITSLAFAGNVVVYTGDRAPELDPGSSATQRQRRRRLVFGEQMSDGFQAVDEIVISRDGASYAYVGREMGDPQQSRPGYSVCPPLTAMLFLNGESITSDSIISSVSFTGDGRLVYVSRLGCVARGRSRVVLGEKELSRHTENITAVAVSPDGRHTAIVGCTGSEAEGRCVLTLDGKALRESSSFDHLTFNADGTMLAYAERQATGQWRMVIGDQAGPSVDAIGDKVLFSPDGRRHAYTVTTAGTASVVTDGLVGPSFDVARDLIFSENAKHLGYSAANGRQRFVVVDRTVGPTFAWVSAPQFDAEGTELRFIAQDGRQFLRRAVAAQ